MRYSFAALILGCILAPAPVLAAAHGVRLSYGGDPRTAIAISWNSNDPTDHTVRYGLAPGTLDRNVTADATMSAAPLGWSFTALLLDLAPDTTYFYRVGGAAGTFYPANDRPPFQVATRAAGPCEPFRFVLLGDNRADLDGFGSNPLWSEILVEALEHAPDFFVNTGDMVKDGTSAGQWNDFLDASEVGWALVPSLLTMGNHDEDEVSGDEALYNRLFGLPRNSRTDTEDYYSLDVGPIHFVSLSTQLTGPGTTELADMVDWLDRDLAATDRPWKIVFFHKAIYSRGNHSTGEESAGAINAAFVPVFDARHVDLVFNGHSHDYERFAPSRGVDRAFGGAGRALPAGDGSGLLPLVPDGDTGTSYLVSGGAGALTTDIFGFTCMDAACTLCSSFNVNCEEEVLDNDLKATVRYDGRHNFAVFDVVAETLTASVWVAAAGNGGTAEKIDDFVIQKSRFDLACDEPAMPDAGVLDAASAPRLDAAPGQEGDGGRVVALAAADGCGCRAARQGRGGVGGSVLAWLAAVTFRRRRTSASERSR